MKYLIKLFAIIFIIFAGFSLANFAVAEDTAPVIDPTVPILEVYIPVPESDITQTSIKLNGIVKNDGGSPVLAVGFMWGTTSNYTNSISTPNNTESYGDFYETLTGLTCGTTYHYQIFAINSVGTGTLGDLTFTTADCSPTPKAPAVEILQTPTNILPTSATISGIIKNSGTEPITEAGFNWGTTTSYGNNFSTSSAIASGDDFSKALSGLTCATTYHYQVYAINSVGTASTSDGTFLTAVCPPNGPQAGGSNDNEGATGIIPNTQGSNGPEGTGIIPTTQGSNDPESTSTPTIVTQERSIVSFGGGSGSRIGGSVLPTGSSVGDTASSCTTINASLRPGSTGSEVTKLQELLNKLIDAKLTISGKYDAATVAAVKAFQLKYAADILAPWGVTEPSGIAGFTTNKKLNELSCAQEFPLSGVEQYLINQFKVGSQSTTTPSITPEATTTPSIPVEVGTDTVTPQETQTAGAANSEVSSSIFQKIINFFKNIF